MLGFVVVVEEEALGVEGWSSEDDVVAVASVAGV